MRSVGAVLVALLLALNLGPRVHISEQVQLFKPILAVSSLNLILFTLWIVRETGKSSIPDLEVVDPILVGEFIDKAVWSCMSIGVSLIGLLWLYPVADMTGWAGRGSVPNVILFFTITYMALTQMSFLAYTMLPLSKIQDDMRADLEREARKQRDRDTRDP